MVSTSENTFGARLRRAQDLVTFISGFSTYAPPRPQESIAGMTTLINTIISGNASESSLQQNYKAAVDARVAAFTAAPGSVEKLLSPIRGAVVAQYGKISTEADAIRAIVKKIRATKLTKAPADPTKPSQEKTISQSERSYGSITQFFNDIINTLTQFNAYNPSSPSLKIVSLQAIATQLTTLNNTVAQKTQQLKAIRLTRQNQYAELSDRAQRIKAYVKAQYGNTSAEYNLVKGLSI